MKNIILNYIKIFSKIDCRFISSKKNFIFYKKKNFFLKHFSYYKEVQYVKSSLFEITKNNKITEDYIVLLDFYPYSNASSNLDKYLLIYKKI